MLLSLLDSEVLFIFLFSASGTEPDAWEEELTAAKGFI